MDILTNLTFGLKVAGEPYNLMVAAAGLILGVIVGVLPGLGGANGCAILIPVTFVMPPVAAVILLSCLYWGSLYGGCHLLDPLQHSRRAVGGGHHLRRLSHGQEGPGRTGAQCRVLRAFCAAPFLARSLLTFFAPVLAAFALRFGPPEVFAVMLLTFSAFVGLVGKSPIKTLVATAFGFIMASVGIDIVSGELRLTFGS